MEFLKKMKSREMIEMSLKTIAAVLLGLILIILMEGMIYGIYMNKIKDSTTTQWTPSACVAYCEKTGDNDYNVYLYNTESKGWQTLDSAGSKVITKEEIESSKYEEIIWRAPNAFDVSINGIHYVVMAVFIVAIGGLYGWRFYKLHRDYVSFEKKYNKTGKLPI